jgi:hypothetical protein
MAFEALLATERLVIARLAAASAGLSYSPSIGSLMTAAVTSVSLLPARTRRRYVRCRWTRRVRRSVPPVERFCPRMERFLSTDGTQGPFIYSLLFSSSLSNKKEEQS